MSEIKGKDSAAKESSAGRLGLEVSGMFFFAGASFVTPLEERTSCRIDPKTKSYLYELTLFALLLRNLVS